MIVLQFIASNNKSEMVNILINEYRIYQDGER